MDMQSFPNQYRVKISKKLNAKKGGFIQMNTQDFYEAAQILNSGALKLYVYLAKNQDGYECYLSGHDFQKCFNVSESTYRRALQELKRTGYLKENKGEKHKYYFSTTPIQEDTYEMIKERIKKIGALIRDKEAIITIKAKLDALSPKDMNDEKEKLNRAKETLKELEEIYNKQLEDEWDSVL